jgi:hypothetical protein
MSRRFTLTAAVLFALTAPFAQAAEKAALKCAADKHKAAVKKAASKLKCHQKANANDVAVDGTCLATAESKFDAAIAKAVSRGGCVAGGSGSEIEAVVDTFVDDILGLTPVAPPTCGQGPYPQCGGTCNGGLVCRAFIQVHRHCGGGQGQSTTCSAFCDCVEPATACNGAPCNRVCSLNTRDDACGGADDTAVCCGGFRDECEGRDLPCCCALSCDESPGAPGSCQQDLVCNATLSGTQCQ